MHVSFHFLLASVLGNYVVKEESADVILKELNEDLVKGLELVKRIAIKALA